MFSGRRYKNWWWFDCNLSWIAMHDRSVQRFTIALNQKAAILYDVLVDEILDVVKITRLGNCIVVVAVREVFPDLWF